MSKQIPVLVIAILELAFLLILAAAEFRDGHPHPIRQWRTRRGLREQLEKTEAERAQLQRMFDAGQRVEQQMAVRISQLDAVRRVAASIAIDPDFGPKLPGLRAVLAASDPAGLTLVNAIRNEEGK